MSSRALLLERRPALSAAGIATLALLIVAGWMLPGLLARDPWNPDEAYTFGLVYHILNHGDWIVPTLAGEPFMEKPPVFFITAAGFARLFGGALPLHDAARLAAAFYVGLTLLFTFLAARTLYGRDSGIAAVLVLVGCIGYVHPAHLLVTDNALVAGLAMALYGLAVSSERPALGGVLTGTGAGIAFLSKGLIGPGMIGLIAAILPLAAPWRTPAYARALAIAALAFAPWGLLWPWLLYQESPALFREWLVVNNFGRYTGKSRLGPEHDHLMYVKILPWFALPALPLAAWNLWSAARRGVNAVDLRGIGVPLAACCVIFGVVSSACNQRYLYAVPLLVPLSLLAAANWAAPPAWLTASLRGLAIGVALVSAAVLWAGWWILLQHWPAGIADALLAARPGYVPDVDPVLASFAIVLTLGALVAFRASCGSLDATVKWATAVALAWGLLNTLWLPYLDFGNSYRGVVAQLAARLPKDAGCIANRHLGEPQRAMLEYFAGIVTYGADTPKGKSCDLLLVQASHRRVAAVHDHEWTRIWNGSRPGDTSERFWLFRRQGLRVAF